MKKKRRHHAAPPDVASGTDAAASARLHGNRWNSSPRVSIPSPGRVLGNLLPQGLRVTARIRVRQYLPDVNGKGQKPRLFAPARHSRHARRRTRRPGAGLHARPGRNSHAGRRRRRRRTLRTGLRSAVAGAAQRREAARTARLAAQKRHGDAQKAARSPARQLSDAHGTGEEQAGGTSPRRARRGRAGTRGSAAAAPEPPFQLTEEQLAALREYCAQMDALARGEKRPFAHLLFGITGSGKTAVYLELAHACLKRGRSALILAPEVAIALKLRRDAEQRFPGAPIFFYHGYQSQQQRERTFRRLAARKEPCLVIGTRSALFLPLPPLGAIVLDEEHDGSFKQEDRLPYQAKEVAWERAGRHRALLILGSATPDIKTFHAAKEGLFPVSRLTHRTGGGTLPAIELVDIKNQPASQTAFRPRRGGAAGNRAARRAGRGAAQPPGLRAAHVLPELRHRGQVPQLRHRPHLSQEARAARVPLLRSHAPLSLALAKNAAASTFCPWAKARKNWRKAWPEKNSPEPCRPAAACSGSTATARAAPGRMEEILAAFAPAGSAGAGGHADALQGASFSQRHAGRGGRRRHGPEHARLPLGRTHVSASGAVLRTRRTRRKARTRAHSDQRRQSPTAGSS